MTNEDSTTPEAGRSTFRTTLIRVLIVQIVTLTLLALLQLRYRG